ncbi:C-type lectin 1-like isoform X1 [Biomphalaria glabrata]|uniref:C-type lectin 1-like isoform X1 n=1 Tax=Biomphalaria glabrata TaxID=6526 RepID=A0A9W2ZIR1_BIOGL|nr:C-type lectin 1-like isoform X1 [Biomphalaria glabrata]
MKTCIFVFLLIGFKSLALNQGRQEKETLTKRSISPIDVLCKRSPDFKVLTYGKTKMCLYYGQDICTYAEAQGKCRSRNSTLAIFNTAEKFRILYPMDMVWIGLDDIANEGTYRWADGSILDLQSNLRYTIFQAGEPNAAFDFEDCVCNRCYYDYDKLYDTNCAETYNYLCEKVFR